MMRGAGRSFPCWYMMLGRYLGTGKHGGLYLVSGCVLSVKVQPSGLLQELSWLMLVIPVSCQVMSYEMASLRKWGTYVRAFLHKWCLTGWLLCMNGMGEGVASLPEYGHFFFCFGMSCTISKSSWRFSTLALATFMRTESPSEEILCLLLPRRQ